MNTKVPPPKNPTMEQSFGPKFTEDQLKIIMDPRGYLDAEEKAEAEQKKQQVQLKSSDQDGQKEPLERKSEMQEEFGFKYKGPEPTRYGDWCLKGKCVDF